MPFADINGQRIHFEDTGGGGVPLVLAHGFLMDSTMFDPQVAALRDEWRVITWDQRGHGQTVSDGQRFSFWDSAADLAGLLDHLDIRQAVVGGMSQGGFIALRLALKRRDRVEALVLIDSQAGLELPEKVGDYETMAQVWSSDGPSEALGQMVAAVILGRYEKSDAWVATWQQRYATGVEAVYRCLMDRDDVTSRLREIAVPVLVIHGDDDIAIPMERAETLAAGLPAAQLVVIKGGSHASNLTQPDQVNEAIRKFLREVKGAGGV